MCMPTLCGPLAVQGIHSCARSLSLLVQLSPSPPARRKSPLTTPLQWLRTLQPPLLTLVRLLPTPVRLLLLPAPPLLTPVRLLLALRKLPRRPCKLRLA